MKKFLAVILIFSISNLLYGQNKLNNDLINETSRNQIGIDISRLFGGIVGANMLYKRRFKKNSLNSFRINTELYIDESLKSEIENGDFSSFVFNSSLLENTYRVGLKLGLERNKILKNSLSIYYGGEIGYRYYKIKGNTGINRILGADGNVEDFLFSFNDFNETRLILGAFGGLNYSINEYFSVSLESGLESAFISSKRLSSQLFFNSGNESNGDLVSRRSFQTLFRYLKFINFNINF